MTISEAKKRIVRLRQEIERHNYLYYVKNKPEISDRDYDRFYHELESLEKQYPQLTTSYSPTQRVGGEPLKSFHQVRHSIPMMSLANTYNKAELLNFYERLQRLANGYAFTTIVEPKIDGIAISLYYESGILISGSTRGDGRVGDDITNNLRTIRSIPFQLKINKLPSVFEVRGEVYMSRKGFTALNRTREESGQEPFANPRNAAAGSLKLLDSRLVAQRPLDVVLYGTGELDGIEFETHELLIQTLAEMGLKTLPRIWKCGSIQQIYNALDQLETMRRLFPFEIDGGVIKVNERKLYAGLGATAKSPRWAVAYKYEPERAETRLKAVTVQVGRTGVLTPVAVLEPVLLAGSTIRSATLHNVDEIQRKDIRIGDMVFIEKAGDVIPDIIAVNTHARIGKERMFFMPDRCPVCGEKVTRHKGEVAFRCENLQCPAQIKRWILHFAARGAMDIDGLGKALVDQLVDRKLVSTPADLYELTHDQVVGLERMAEKSVQNLLNSIEVSKRREFWRLIFALGIRYVGAKMAQVIEQHVENIDEIMQITVAALQDIHDIGPVAAQSIVDYFHAPANQTLILRLNQAGVNMKRGLAHIRISAQLKGKTFVLTGALSNMTREQAVEKIRNLGGNVNSNVSKKTSYVIAGAEPGSKLEKARQIGIKVLNEKEFSALLLEETAE